MFALSRRKDESIIIDDNVEIRVIEIEGSQVVLDIKVPENVSVCRSEVYIRIKREKYRETLPGTTG